MKPSKNSDEEQAAPGLPRQPGQTGGHVPLPGFPGSWATLGTPLNPVAIDYDLSEPPLLAPPLEWWPEDARATPKRHKQGFVDISELAGAADKIGGLFSPDDGLKSNFSTIGAVKDATVRNLEQIRKANPAVYEAAVRAATSASHATALINAAAPQVERTLGKNGPSFPEFHVR